MSKAQIHIFFRIALFCACVRLINTTAKYTSVLALNLGVTLVVAEGQEMPEGMHGFGREHLQTLAPLLRQPVSQFRLLRDQRLLIALSHQELVFDVDNEDQEGLFLGWAVN
jgi:hypothetical protein